MKKLLLLVFIAGSLTLSVAAESVPGTKVSLTPPDSFKISTQFPGYMMQETGSSIMVTEISAPVREVTKGFNKGDLATKGMKLIDKRDIKLDDHNAVLLHVSQSAFGTEFLKWMVVFGDELETVLIDGLFGRKIIAKAQDTDTNNYRFVYHTLLYTKDGYYIFQGFSNFNKRNEYEAIFEKILQSFKRK